MRDKILAILCVCVLYLGGLVVYGWSHEKTMDVGGVSIVANRDVANAGKTPESAIVLDVCLAGDADSGFNNSLAWHIWDRDAHDLLLVEGRRWEEMFQDGVEYLRWNGVLYKKNPDMVHSTKELMSHPIGWGDGSIVVTAVDDSNWHYVPIQE